MLGLDTDIAAAEGFDKIGDSRRTKGERLAELAIQPRQTQHIELGKNGWTVGDQAAVKILNSF